MVDRLEDDELIVLLVHASEEIQRGVPVTGAREHE